MALAKKCDRCGELYEHYSIKHDEKGINGLCVINSQLNDRYSTVSFFDLCPDCCGKFIDWLSDDKKIEQED